jgi:hypothetical protein
MREGRGLWLASLHDAKGTRVVFKAPEWFFLTAATAE